MITVNLLTSPIVPEVMPRVATLLTSALARGNGEFLIDDLEDLFLRGVWQLWVQYDEKADLAIACAATELYQYPQKKSCIIRMMAALPGRRGEWMPCLETIERWARSQGCVTMEIIGRDGWAAFLPDYERRGVLLARAL